MRLSNKLLEQEYAKEHDNLHWSDIAAIFDPVTELDLITEFDF